MDAKQLAAQQFDGVVALRRDLHSHPEPSFEEVRTTQVLARQLEEVGIPFRRFEPTGLMAEIRGGRPGKTVALRADIDALSIEEKSGVEFTSQNPGLMHACGHDTHAAMLMGAARALWQHKPELPGTVRLLFQPAEEIASGARRIIEQGALEGVDMIFGLHIFSQMPVGQIAVGEGPQAAAADRFTIELEGAACHGAMPHTGRDATVAAAALVMNLQTIASREIDPAQPVVVTVGTLQSGSRFNIVSGRATLTGTVRCFDRGVHAQLEEAVRRVVENTAAAYGCTARLHYEVMVDVLLNDPVASAYSRAAALKVAACEQLVTTMEKMMGAEDFAEYTARIPGGFVGLGGGGEHPQHSDYFVLDEAALETGTAWYIQVACDYLAHTAP